MTTMEMEAWVCPQDGVSRLDWSDADGSGCSFLACRQCGRQFAVEDGIPDFTVAGVEDHLQRRERTHRESLVVFAGSRRVRYEWKVETEAILRRLGAQPGERVLDAGCGSGRITWPLLARGVEVTAVDFSLTRLRYLRGQVAADAPLHLAAADVTRLPLQANSFDRIVSGQVLEHLPSPDLRRRMMDQFLRLLVPGGTLVLTVYNYSRTYRRMGQSQEVIHSSGIFDHRYIPDELRREFAGFAIRELCGVALGIPGGNRILPWLGAPGRWLDHLLERSIRLSCDRGAFLLVHATKPSTSVEWSRNGYSFATTPGTTGKSEK